MGSRADTFAGQRGVHARRDTQTHKKYNQTRLTTLDSSTFCSRFLLPIPRDVVRLRHGGTTTHPQPSTWDGMGRGTWDEGGNEPPGRDYRCEREPRFHSPREGSGGLDLCSSGQGFLVASLLFRPPPFATGGSAGWIRSSTGMGERDWLCPGRQSRWGPRGCLLCSQSRISS